LALGDATPLQALLECASTREILEIVREHKLILKLRSTDSTKRLASVFRAAANRITCGEGERRRLVLYSDFVEIYTVASADFAAQAASLLPAFQQLSLIDLLELAESFVAQALEQNTVQLNRRLGTLRPHDCTTLERADASEFEVQNFQGRGKDLLFAYARPLNGASSHVRADSRRCGNREWIKTAKSAFEALFVIANQWNSLDYAMDKVTYGEWVVADVSRNEKPVVRFDESDILYAKAKIVGMRRHLIETMFIVKERRHLVRSLMESVYTYAIPHAQAFFSSRYREAELDSSDMQALRACLQFELDAITADDDMLVVSDQSLVSYYAAGMLVRAYRDVGTRM
jgi:hypothetical protein